MNSEKLFANFPLLSADWGALFKVLMVVILLVLIAMFIYDRFVQRKNQLLINFPLIGRMRYVFYMLRGPMRQYFGDETFYDSFEKLEWVNKVASGENPYLSLLAQGRVFLVTADSINMVSEVCATDKPVIAIAQNAISPKHKRFIQSINERLSQFESLKEQNRPLNELNRLLEKVVEKVAEKLD